MTPNVVAQRTERVLWQVVVLHSLIARDDAQQAHGLACSLVAACAFSASELSEPIVLAYIYELIRNLLWYKYRDSYCTHLRDDEAPRVSSIEAAVFDTLDWRGERGRGNPTLVFTILIVSWRSISSDTKNLNQ